MTLIGIGGGPIAEAEYRIALALGATVVLIADSGGRAADLLMNPPLDAFKRNLVELPKDVESLAALVREISHSGEATLLTDVREKLAREIHSRYVQKQRERAIEENPSLVGYEGLAPDLRTSNLGQADDIIRKLSHLGFEIVPVSSEEAQQELFRFDRDALLELARQEHGRWVAEKARSGWRVADVKDISQKKNPSLVPWDDLPAEEKQKDVDAAESIPSLLALVGYRIRKRKVS